MSFLQKYLLKRRLHYAQNIATLDDKAALVKTYIAHGKYLGQRTRAKRRKCLRVAVCPRKSGQRSESPGKRTGEGCGNSLRALGLVWTAGLISLGYMRAPLWVPFLGAIIGLFLYLGYRPASKLIYERDGFVRATLTIYIPQVIMSFILYGIGRCAAALLR